MGGEEWGLDRTGGYRGTGSGRAARASSDNSEGGCGSSGVGEIGDIL